MSTTYGTASSITIPSDGDTIDAADVNTPLAAIWDQHDVLADTAALTAILVPTHGLIRYVRGYGHYVFVTSGTYSASTAASPWILASVDGTAGRWVLDLTSQANKTTRRSRGCTSDLVMGNANTAKTQAMVGIAMAETLSASNAVLYGDHLRYLVVDDTAAFGLHVYFPLNSILVDGATITSAKIWVRPNTAHASLPAMMPAMSVIRYDPSAQVQDSLRAAGMYDDQSVDVAAYNAHHTITFTPDQNATVDFVNTKGYQYWLVFCNEGHTNAVAELQLFGIQVVMSTKGYL